MVVYSECTIFCIRYQKGGGCPQIRYDALLFSCNCVGRGESEKLRYITNVRPPTQHGYSNARIVPVDVVYSRI